MRAIDISFPQIGQDVSPAWWAQLNADGWELAIIGLWGGVSPNTEAERWLHDARAAGLLTACYIAINGDHPGGWHVEQGAELAGAEWEHTLFCAVDVEIDGITLDNIHEGVTALQARLKPPAIYTGEWFWSGHLGNLTAFSNVPLWTAQYDGVAILDSAKPYGGWTPARIVGKQYSGTGQLHGVTCDLSVFSDAWIAGLLPLPAEPVSDAVQVAKDTLTLLTAAFDGLWRRRYPRTKRTVLEQLQHVAKAEVAAVGVAYKEHQAAVERLT